MKGNHLIWPQTNLQLYPFLRQYGHNDADIARVEKLYSYAQYLFFNRFRSGGRPFVDHLVGTASLVALCRPAFDVVLAALIHAAYEQGYFRPELTLRPVRGSKAQRRILRSKFGSEIENLVFSYYTFDWKLWTQKRVSERTPEPLPNADCPCMDVILIRCANELDNSLDWEIKGGEWIKNNLPRLTVARQIADDLGHKKLADIIGEQIARLESLLDTEPMANVTQYSYSISRIPRIPSALEFTRRLKRRLPRR